MNLQFEYELPRVTLQRCTLLVTTKRHDWEVVITLPDGLCIPARIRDDNGVDKRLACHCPESARKLASAVIKAVRQRRPWFVDIQGRTFKMV